MGRLGTLTMTALSILPGWGIALVAASMLFRLLQDVGHVGLPASIGFGCIFLFFVLLGLISPYLTYRWFNG